jgi:hypothetical protein
LAYFLFVNQNSLYFENAMASVQLKSINPRFGRSCIGETITFGIRTTLSAAFYWWNTNGKCSAEFEAF